MVDELRRGLVEGRLQPPRVGKVVMGRSSALPFRALDSDGEEIAAISDYLRDLALGDSSPLTVRSYAYGLLRWFRVLWLLEVDWERATEAETAALVGWLRIARNPQRVRRRSDSPPPGSVNVRTGKPMLGAGYAGSTINHNLSVVSGFYEFHGHFGVGPVANPVPSSAERRRALAHRNPLEPVATVRRSRLRQKTAERLPRALTDAQWDELIAVMTCDRDRALLLFYVSSGARASELLGVRAEDLDWSRQLIYVVSKGSRVRQQIPASPEAFLALARYLDHAGPLVPGELIWRTRRGESRPLSYSAMRRNLQRANAKLATNWSLHDLRHTAATRLANDPNMTLPEVQTILRHAAVETTGRYLRVRVEDMFDKLQEHYTRPRIELSYPAGYDPDDVRAVFGG